MLNGVELQRNSNEVSDAVDGVTFSLKQADTAKTTTFTVGLDKAAITSAMQDVISKYNTFYNDYKTRTATSTDSDGNIVNGVFTGDATLRSMVNQVHQAIMDAPDGLSAGNTFPGASSVGLKTNRDGTLSLDATTFQNALDKDATGVAHVFQNSATSTDARLAFVGATGATTTSPISFAIGQPSGGVTTGTFTTALADGSTQSATLTSTNGLFYGAAGTSFEGMVVQGSAGAAGTLRVSRGAGQSLQDLVRTLTSSSTGGIGNILQNISDENYRLNQSISSQQARLDRREASLKDLYARMESTVSQLQSLGQSLGSL
jgi:flagellar hook-associated protein 2